MVLLKLYSRRKRQAGGTGSDVFRYDDIPDRVRVQIAMNMDAALKQVCGEYENTLEEAYTVIAEEMREEVGVHRLDSKRASDAHDEVTSFVQGDASVEQVLDVLELWYAVGQRVAELERTDEDQIKFHAARINARLLEAGIGFELVDGRIVEKSSEFLHQESVLPALHLLSESRFSGANKEFRDAHEAFRNGEYEDCLTDCLKAFESVMKVIAGARGWSVPSTATAKVLIDAMYANEFIPTYMQNQFAGLRSMLEGSVPTTRNKSGGHGRGAEKREVPKSLAALQLHQTAAIIVFLAELDQ